MRAAKLKRLVVLRLVPTRTRTTIDLLDPGHAGPLPAEAQRTSLSLLVAHVTHCIETSKMLVGFPQN